MWIDSFSFDNAAGPIPVIPEPMTASLFGFATCLLAMNRRRKKPRTDGPDNLHSISFYE